MYSFNFQYSKNTIKIVFILCFIFHNNLIFSQKINFNSNLEKTFELASIENKLVFVEYYNAKCHQCALLEPIMNDKEVSDFYNNNFISYRLDTFEIKPNDAAFMKKNGLQFEGYPYFMFFDKNQVLVHFSGTIRDKNFLLTIGKTALNPDIRTDSFEKKYLKGDKSRYNLMYYLDVLHAYKRDAEIIKVGNELFEVYPKNELLGQESFYVLKKAIIDIENGFFKHWINNIEALNAFGIKINPKYNADDLQQIILKSIYRPGSKNWDLKKINEVKTLVLKTNLSKNPNVYFWEQESKLLVANDENEKALLLFKSQFAFEKSTLAKCFLVEHFMNLMTQKTDLEVLNTLNKAIEKSKDTKVDDAKNFNLGLYYFKINDKLNAKNVLTTLKLKLVKSKTNTEKIDLILKQLN